jgi:SAM-dependent methyltransferase
MAFNFPGLKHSEICLLDIGCGNGRALNFGMFLHFKEVTGIDLDHLAVEKAIANCRQMGIMGYSTIYNVFETDACKFEIPYGINLIYLFNPFGKKTMEYVVDNILKYQQYYKKDIFIVYSKPVHKDLFSIHSRCIKLLERFIGSGTKTEMIIFKITNV